MSWNSNEIWRFFLQLKAAKSMSIPCFSSTKTCMYLHMFNQMFYFFFFTATVIKSIKGLTNKRPTLNSPASMICHLPGTQLLNSHSNMCSDLFDLSWRVIKSSQVCQVNTDVMLGKFPLGSHVSKWQVKVSHVWVEEGHWDIAENVSPGRCKHFVKIGFFFQSVS